MVDTNRDHHDRQTLDGRGASRIRPDHQALCQVLRELGEPQRSFPSILLVGTNGKGSVAAMLSAILAAHGQSVGLYTSPHLVRVEERIRLNGTDIASAELDRLLGRLDPYPHLTYFETLTAAAFLAFAESSVDCAVLEAGIGGSWDATRLACSTIAGLTNIGSDHRRWLGSTSQEIAREKGQALAAAGCGVLGPEVPPQLLPHLAAPEARAAGTLVELGPGPTTAVVSDSGSVVARWSGAAGDCRAELMIPFTGQHQHANLHLALALAVAAERHGLLPQLQPEAVRTGLRQARWPGRLSSHRICGRTVLLDGAHNLEAALALAGYLGEQRTTYHLLFSCLEDKPMEEMAAALTPLVGEVAICPLRDERAMPVARMAQAFPAAIVRNSWQAALGALPDPVLAAGSLRLVGALLAEEEREQS